MKLSAAIFDLDGTIVDSREQWTKSFLAVLKDLGKSVTGDPIAHGVSIVDNWRNLISKYQVKTDKNPEELKNLTYEYYVKQLPEVGLIEGSVDFIRDLKNEGVKIGLATGCEWWVVEKVFDYLGLNDLFDATVTGEEPINLKPSPDPLLVAADKLGISPEDCLMIGDTEADIEAARSVGMKVVIISFSEKSELRFRKANLVVEYYSDITPEAIDQL